MQQQHINAAKRELGRFGYAATAASAQKVLDRLAAVQDLNEPQTRLVRAAAVVVFDHDRNRVVTTR